MKYFIITILSVVIFLVATTGNSYSGYLTKQDISECENTNKTGNDKDAPVQLSVDIVQAVTQISHLVFHSDFCFEIPFAEKADVKAHPVFDTSIFYTNFYKVLFRQIISPNAP